MSNILKAIQEFEEKAEALRDQQKSLYPTLGFSCDDYPFVNASTLVAIIGDLHDQLPTAYHDITNRIMGDLATLSNLLDKENNQIVIENDKINEEVNSLFGELRVEMKKEPEYELSETVIIGLNKLNPEEVTILETVYSQLNLTHVLREPRKHIVFFNPKETPKLGKVITNAFNKKFRDARCKPRINIENYIHYENVFGINGFVNAIKARQ